MRKNRYKTKDFVKNKNYLKNDKWNFTSTLFFILKGLRNLICTITPFRSQIFEFKSCPLDFVVHVFNS